MKTILQIPLDTALRKEAEKEALEQGFSSIQEVVRVLLKKIANRELTVKFEETVQLSPRAIKRYNKILKDFKSGKNTFTASNVDELMDHLRNAS